MIVEPFSLAHLSKPYHLTGSLCIGRTFMAYAQCNLKPLCNYSENQALDSSHPLCPSVIPHQHQEKQRYDWWWLTFVFTLYKHMQILCDNRYSANPEGKIFTQLFRFYLERSSSDLLDAGDYPALPLVWFMYIVNFLHFFFSFAVCSVSGKEVPMVCLLGRPWDPVFSGPWNWSAHLPSLPGKIASAVWKCRCKIPLLK